MAIHIELEYSKIFVKYTTKSECSIDRHLLRSILKSLWLTKIRAAYIPINSNMNYVANQLIKKNLGVQKSPILVLNFYYFLKHIFKYGFAHY